MVEIDMPMDNTTAYDREKGLRWGRTLQNSMAVKNGGSHGLAGGFGVGAVQQRAPRKKGDVEEDDNLDWNDAVRQGKVLSTQTLGGQYPDTDEVQYMVGVFQGSTSNHPSPTLPLLTNKISQRTSISPPSPTSSTSALNSTTSTPPPRKNANPPPPPPKKEPPRQPLPLAQST